MDIAGLQRIKRWQVGHRATHPVEYHLWDGVLTLWLAGWVGLLPAWAFEAWWALPACLLAMLGPDLYVRWRSRLHRHRRLRCDWLVAVGPSLSRRPHVRR